MRELSPVRAAAPASSVSGDPGRFFASVRLRLGPVNPHAFLAGTDPSVRGLCQTAGRWSAFGGAAAQLDSRTLAGNGSAFARVLQASRAVYDAAWVRSSGAEATSPRFYGGFAFHAEEPLERGLAGARFWAAFPAARFILPRYELQADDDGAWLTVTDAFAGGVAPDRALDSLESEGEALRRRLESGSERRLPGAEAAVPAASSIHEPVDAGVWRAGIERILRGIESGEVRKVVLARPLDVTLPEVADPVAILARLRARNPLAHLFLLQFSPEEFLVGAAPELLGAMRGDRFDTMAVAGSTPRGVDPESDAWLGRQLLSSRKNRNEQQIVVEGILESLAAYADGAPVVGDPELLHLSGIQHIMTGITCNVTAGTHVLELIEVLHPTAAVCGSPREAALALLEAEEPAERGWYAGPVGWFDATGGGAFAPALRSAVAQGPLLRLYAGAGIVDGSRPGAEWDETRVKLQTVLKALGVARVP